MTKDILGGKFSDDCQYLILLISIQYFSYFTNYFVFLKLKVHLYKAIICDWIAEGAQGYHLPRNWPIITIISSLNYWFNQCKCVLFSDK